MDCQEPRTSQKEGQEGQGELGGNSPSYFKVPWSSWPSFWLFLGSLAIHQAILILKPAYEAK